MTSAHDNRRNCKVDRGWFETHVYDFRVHIVNLNIDIFNGDDKFYSKHTCSASDEYKHVLFKCFFNRLIYPVRCDGTTTTSEWDGSISPLLAPRLWCFSWWVALTMMRFSNTISMPVLNPIMVYSNEGYTPLETRCCFCSILLIFLCFSFCIKVKFIISEEDIYLYSKQVNAWGPQERFFFKF